MKNRFKEVMTILLFVILLLPAPSAVSGEIYKWKDTNGNIVFSDSPPPGVGVEIKELKEDTTERAKTRDYFPKVETKGLREKRPYTDIHVIMYMTSWCPYCARARHYLRSLDVDLIEYDVEQDKSKREEMLGKSGGSGGVPLIDVEGIIIRGYNPDALKKAIENRRNL